MSSLNYFYPCKHNNMKLNNSHLKEFLDEKVELYNRPAFIEADPISIPLQFTKKQDIEVAGLLTRKHKDSNAVFELDTNLRKMDSEDPVKYDFALFGLNVFEDFY